MSAVDMSKHEPMRECTTRKNCVPSTVEGTKSTEDNDNIYEIVISVTMVELTFSLFEAPFDAYTKSLFKAIVLKRVFALVGQMLYFTQ